MGKTQSREQQVNFPTLPGALNFDEKYFKRGLSEIKSYISSIYPNQPEPLFRHFNLSFIQSGGQSSEPLDYIYVYKNAGNPELGASPHWHYISMGLSDIYSYSDLYEADLLLRDSNKIYAAQTQAIPQLYPRRVVSQESKSGFGFELTFRLKCENSDQQPPLWPLRMMQDLAKYVFNSKIPIKRGDHMQWPHPLDGEGESRISHILMTTDSQLEQTNTSLGKVDFIQLVGVCLEELQAARQYNVEGVLKIMKEREETGGRLLVTDITRGMTIFELDPVNQDRIEAGIREFGSDMAGISAQHKYSSEPVNWLKRSQDNQNNESRAPSRMSMESESALRIENSENLELKSYRSLYLLIKFETAKLLPIALRGRLAHGRQFTVQTFKGDLTTTFVPDTWESGCMVSREKPFARQGTWLQIYVPEELRLQMLESLESLPTDSLNEPMNLFWPKYKLQITITDEIDD